MNTRLALSVLSLVSLGALTTPASAIKVKVPTGGDIVTVSVPVINLSNDYIKGESFGQASTGFLFTGYDGQFNPLATTAPHSTGTVEFQLVASGPFVEQPSFQFSLYGFDDLTTATTPDFTDNDPGLVVDLVSQDAGPCGLDPNCVTYTLPNTITVPATSTTPATVPEPAPIAAFGLGAVGLGALMVRAGRRQKA